MKTDQAELINKIITRGTETIVPGATQLKALLESGKKLNIYLGIDPTATRIHLGHAVPLRKLQYFAELGHNVYFLIGDFTALVGDTSDKNTERPMLDRSVIEQNFQSYKALASKVVDFSKIKVVHNSDWLKELGFADLLNLTSLFSVNDFISRELIRRRLDEGTRVSLAEVLYPIMQGYDSFHLETDVQLGGTDQIFNMQAGRTMIKQKLNKESFIVSNGFLLGTDGRKMSKSWGNAIWLDDSADDIFGKVMSLKDDLILNYFALATNMSTDELVEIEKQIMGGAHPMALKKELARRIITELCGAELVAAAEEHFVQGIQEKVAPDNTTVISLPENFLSQDDFLTLLVKEELAPSKTEARRLLAQGAIYLNEERVDGDKAQIDLATGENVLRVGKRRYLKIMV